MSKFNVSNPSGFHELNPASEQIRQSWLKIIGEAFTRYGFITIATPLVEREENLLGKGGNAKEMYVLKRLLDEDGDKSHSGNALRFDQTVPLALYVARHLNDLKFPFRRAVMGPVFRGERAQKGRFRQFDQCDIDVIGNGELSFLNDAEIPAIIIEIFKKLDLGDFVVRINNRRILTGFFASLGINPEQMKTVLDIIDDIEKVSREQMVERLKLEALSENDIQKLFQFIELENPTISDLVSLCDDAVFQQGVAELGVVLEALEGMKVERNYYTVDLKIARGLDYYTGTVYETNLKDHPEFGSVCSGGRYDDLARIFTGKSYPGVGISIGLTRLLSQSLEAGLVVPAKATPTQVLLIAADSIAQSKLLEVGQILRNEGLSVENYFEDKKLGKKFDYADKQGIEWCVVMGERELENREVQVKNMKTGVSEMVSMEDIIKYAF